MRHILTLWASCRISILGIICRPCAFYQMEGETRSKSILLKLLVGHFTVVSWTGELQRIQQESEVAWPVCQFPCSWVTHKGYTIQSRLIRNQTSPGAGSAQLLGSGCPLNNNHTKLGLIPHWMNNPSHQNETWHLASTVLNCGTYFICVFQSASFLLCFRMTW